MAKPISNKQKISILSRKAEKLVQDNLYLEQKIRNNKVERVTIFKEIFRLELETKMEKKNATQKSR